MTVQSDTLGFNLESIRIVQGGFRTVARFWCTDCGDTLDVPVGNPLLPEAIAKTARRRGWQAHAKRKSEALCSVCCGKKPPQRVVHSLGDLRQRPEIAVVAGQEDVVPPSAPPRPMRLPDPHEVAALRAALGLLRSEIAHLQATAHELTARLERLVLRCAR